MLSWQWITVHCFYYFPSKCILKKCFNSAIIHMFSLHTVSTAGCWLPWNRIIAHCHYCSLPLQSQEDKATYHIHKITKWTEMAIVAGSTWLQQKETWGWFSTSDGEILFQDSGTRKLYERTDPQVVSGFQVSLCALGVTTLLDLRHQCAVLRVEPCQWWAALVWLHHEKWGLTSRLSGFWMRAFSFHFLLLLCQLQLLDDHETEDEARVSHFLRALTKANQERPRNVPSPYSSKEHVEHDCQRMLLGQDMPAESGQHSQTTVQLCSTLAHFESIYHPDLSTALLPHGLVKHVLKPQNTLLVLFSPY